MHRPAIIDLAERCKHGAEFHIALTEHQMLMPVATHVLDVEIPQFVSPSPNVVADDAVAKAVNVPDIEGQSEQSVIERTMKPLELSHRLYEHPGFGLETKSDVVILGESENRTQSVNQTIEQRFLILLAVGRSGPQCDAVGAETGGDLDGRMQELDALFPLLRFTANERGLMLATWIDYEPRARLNGHAQAGIPHERRQPFNALSYGAAVRRTELSTFQRDRDAFITDLRKDAQSISERVVCPSIRVVAEVHGRVRLSSRR